jgi:myo-inositol-1(or 4)-monophosphatase
MTDTAERAELAECAARDGAAVALESFRTGIDVETKSSETDVVTEADRAAQRRVLERIARTYPDDPVVGEEEDELKAVPREGASWVVDPIDGTNNYVRNVPTWATAVAAVVDGEPVGAATVLPALGDVYTADGDGAYHDGEPISVSDRTDPRACTVSPTLWWGHDRRDEFAAAAREAVHRFGDSRRFGCAQATLAYVAAGALDGAFSNVRSNPWDTVGGVHLIRRAGGTVTDLDGERWTHRSTGIVASNGRIHDEVLAAARAIEGLD